MCTSITLKSKDGINFFGRTMDFSHPIEPNLYVVPKNYEWLSLATGEKYIDSFAFIGIGQKIHEMLGFFDGINEHGFAAAALYFAGYADYNLSIGDKEEIASIDFLHYLLGRCKTVNDLRLCLSNKTVVGIEDPVTGTTAPLHWIATDKYGNCAVIEQTNIGLNIMGNHIGVMANSPDFNWQMTNLRNYLNVSIEQKNQVQWGDISLKPFGQGGGSTPLPGGFTSPERFVRAGFLKTHVTAAENSHEAILTCFNIMCSVFIPKGIVRTSSGDFDYTKYTAFTNTATCEYYYNSFENSQIIRACLWDYDLNQHQLINLGSIVYPLSF